MAELLLRSINFIDIRDRDAQARAEIASSYQMLKARFDRLDGQLSQSDMQEYLRLTALQKLIKPGAQPQAYYFDPLFVCLRDKLARANSGLTPYSPLEL